MKPVELTKQLTSLRKREGKTYVKRPFSKASQARKKMMKPLAAKSSFHHHEPVGSPSPASPITIPRASSHRWEYMEHYTELPYTEMALTFYKSVEPPAFHMGHIYIYCFELGGSTTWELVDWKASASPMKILLQANHSGVNTSQGTLLHETSDMSLKLSFGL